MMAIRNRWLWRLGIAAMAVLGAWAAAGLNADSKSKPDNAAVERTRKQVRMLDDIYKTAVVLITEKYVNTEEDFAAGAAAVALFDAIKEKGWHETRLLDATGQPYDEDNAPKTDFEKAAIKALKSGKGYYEEIAEIDGKPYLRAATPVPVVSKKCAMCHPHFADVKEGEAIGALGYTLPIE